MKINKTGGSGLEWKHTVKRKAAFDKGWLDTVGF